MPSTISGALFEDVNGDGNVAADPALPLAGVRLFLDLNQNGIRDTGEASTTTDSTGAYSFTDLAPGTYRVAQEAPAGWLQTSPAPTPGPGVFGDITRSFTTPGTGVGDDSYGAVMWKDGSLYVNESVGGDRFLLKVDPLTGNSTYGQNMPDAYQTSAMVNDGDFIWATSFATNQILRIDSSGTVVQSFASPAATPNGIAWDGTSLWVTHYSTPTIYKLNPADGSILGSYAAPGSPMIGLEYDGQFLWATTQDANSPSRLYQLDPATGTVIRSILSPGSVRTADPYDMAFDGQQLWLCQWANNGVTPPEAKLVRVDISAPGAHNVTVGEADTLSDINFGNFQLASVSGSVFNDIDLDGVQDAGDGGLAGWRVFIDGNGNGQFDEREQSSVTDALGNYSIGGLRTGTYSVVEDLAGQRQPRWSRTLPSDGAHFATVTTSGEALAANNFGNFLDRTTPITANEWGTFQGGEMNLYTGLSWVNFSGLEPLEPTFDGAIAYTANSTYAGYDDWRLPTKTEALTAAINGVGPRVGGEGNFYSWTSTTTSGKGGQRAWAVSLYDGSAFDTLLGSHMHLAGVRDTGIVIDDGSAGYSSSGFSAKSTNGAYQGDQNTAAKGDGSKTATWTFSGLEAGATYKVDVTWKVVNGAATNAPFTIRDGATVVGTKSLNQGVAPNDFTTGETTSWEGLGVYTINGSTLSVKLSNLANGTVIADAVRIFKVLPSYASQSGLMMVQLPAGNTPAPFKSDEPTVPVFYPPQMTMDVVTDAGLRPASSTTALPLRPATRSLPASMGANSDVGRNAPDASVVIPRAAAQGIAWVDFDFAPIGIEPK